MSENRQPGKLAVILHADIAGSTTLVQQDEHIAHERIQDTFRRFSEIIVQYHGQVRELRGDALLAEFHRASDAVSATLAFRAAQAEYITQLNDNILPRVRVGIAMGEVVIADNTVTGEGVVLAQRVEQLAEPGGLCITSAINEALPTRMPFDLKSLGEQELKGFKEPVRVYRVVLESGEVIPPPEKVLKAKATNTLGISAAVAAIVLVIAGGVAFWFQPWSPAEEPASIKRMAFPLPEKPSIAVLPFNNLSGDPDQEHLADGLTEEIITTLSKSPNLFVIARNSTFTYKGKAVEARQVAEEQGVRYVLEGSVQRSGNRIRINAQLVDALEGHHLWAESYDRVFDDIFALQDDITQNILIELEVELTQGEELRAIHSRAPKPEAFLYLQKSRVHYYRFNKEDNAIARELATKAAEISPDYPDAWVWLGWEHLMDFRFGWSVDRKNSFEQAQELAEKAYELGSGLAGTNTLLGSLSIHRGQYDEAISYYRKAVELAPSEANAIATLAWGLCYSGYPEEAIPLINQAIRLSPVYPAWYTATLGLAYMMTGDHPKAIAAQEQLIERKSLLQFAYSRLAGIYAMQGNEEKARAYAAELLNIKPDFSISGWSKALIYQKKEDLNRELNALRKAGLPENPPLELPDKPSIAVLPFNAYSDDSEQKHFANGLTEDLTTALSKVPDISVIASTSTQKYKGKYVDVRDVAKEQGVRYILEGSIQKSGDHVRINAQLVDGADGQHVWAEKYDRPATDLFAIQDDIVRRILVEMQIELTEGEHARLAAGGTDNLQAWLLRIQAYNESIKYTRESQIRARELYEAAHKADPDWAMPVAGPSFTHWYEARRGWSDSREESIRLGIESAERAIELEPDHWIGYMALCSMMFMIEETERGIDACRKSIKLAPNSFAAVGVFAIRLSEADREHEAIELFERAIRLSPQYPWWIDFGYGFALHLVGRKEEAVDIYKKGIDKGAQSAPLRVRLAAVYVDLGRMDEAKAAIDDALKINPQFTASKYRKSYPYPGDERYDWYHDLVIRAGLPQ